MPRFQTAPDALYTVAELFEGYDPARPESFGSTPDFRIYHEFVADGGAASTNRPMVMARAEHDCSIMELLVDRLIDRKVVAIMGGHAVKRGSQAYDDAAVASAMLTERGFLVITGGGPGAMEAAHLGAAVGRPGQDLDAALRHLATGVLDSGGKPVTYGGDPKDPAPINPEAVTALGEYYRTGWEVRQSYPAGGGVAIPTWMYGWEPTTVFAGEVAKYFQNSIREDGLLAAATHGIIYAQGSAGTLQEVFQDGAQNFYRSFPAPAEAGRGMFSPMVFLGDFWTVDDPADAGRRTLPVKHLLDKLWRMSSDGPGEADRLVSYVTTPDAAVAAIEAFPGLPVAPALMIASRRQR